MPPAQLSTGVADQNIVFLRPNYGWEMPPYVNAFGQSASQQMRVPDYSGSVRERAGLGP
jgi:hypothetical protein